MSIAKKSFFCYELVVINRYDSSVNENYFIINALKSYLDKNNLGNIRRKEFWGLMNFAYPINNYKKGHYIFFAVELVKSAFIKEVVQFLKKFSTIVRIACFKTDNISEEFSKLAKSSDPKTKQNFSVEGSKELNQSSKPYNRSISSKEVSVNSLQVDE